MNKFLLFLIFIFLSFNSYAVEPVLDHQGMIYFNLSFDAGHSTKTEHDFGFRFDRAMVKPGENMGMDQLVDKPAVFNMKYNSNGLKAFELNGVDYSYVDYALNEAEGDAGDTAAEAETIPEETVEQPKRKIDIPVGVIIGVLIGTVAIASGF